MEWKNGRRKVRLKEVKKKIRKESDLLAEYQYKYKRLDSDFQLFSMYLTQI